MEDWYPLPGQVTSFGPQEVDPIVNPTLPNLLFKSVKDVVQHQLALEIEIQRSTLMKVKAVNNISEIEEQN